MPNRGKNRGSKNNQRNTDGAPDATSSSNAANAGLSRQAIKQAVQQRAGKRKARAAEKEQELEVQKNAGNDLFKAGNYWGAIELYKNALERFGQKPVLLSNLAAAYLKVEHYEEAESAAESALMYDPHMIKARYRRGLARKGIGRFKAAIIDFESVLKQDPTRTEARAQLKIARNLYITTIAREMYDSEDGSEGSRITEDLEWPNYDDSPFEESEVDSDSSDCRHIGNSFPCRFYNHEGCSRKDQCRYSHAPDHKSIRDNVGKNVCLGFLVDLCKFGAKCVYSHEREYLPAGWWDNQDTVALLKGKLSSEDVNLFKSMIDAALEEEAEDESDSESEYVARTGYVRTEVNNDSSSAPTKHESASPEASSERFILVLLLDGGDIHDYQEPTFTALRSKILTKKAVSPKEALAYLASRDLTGVFVADAAISKRKHAQVLSKLVEYTKGGGSTVIGGSFSSFIRPSDMAMFFANSWGVDWKSGSYHRAEFSLNKSHDIAQSNTELASSYSMKALHVKGIAAGAAVYREEGGNATESPAVQIRCGEGYMGYIGDVNWENGSIPLLLSMLRVSTPSPASTPPSQPKSATANGANQAGPSKSSPVQSAVPPASSKKPFILLLALDGDIMEGYKQPTIAAIKAKSPMQLACSAGDALKHLSSPDLGGVFVVDAAITNRQNANIVAKLVAYAKAGGSVLIGGAFSSFVKPKDMNTFFEKSWGFKWTSGSYHRTTFWLNGTHDLTPKNPSLPPSYSMKALHLQGVSPNQMVYRPTTESRLQSLVFAPKEVPSLTESPAVYAPIGKGFLGYIGDVNWEEESAKLALAMLGLLHPPPTPSPGSSNNAQAAPPVTKSASAASGSKATTPAPKPTPVHNTSKPASASSKRFVLLLSLENEDFFATSHAHCLSALRAKVETQQALTGPSALALLNSPELAGVFITDAGIVKPEHAPIVSRLVEIVKSGKSVVVGGYFSAFVNGDEMDTWFKNAWGLTWKGGSYHKAQFTSNITHEMIAGNPTLASTCEIKALHLGGLAGGDAVYLPADTTPFQSLRIADSYLESPVVRRRVGKGYLGYVGDVNAEPNTTNIVLAMLGLLDNDQTLEDPPKDLPKAAPTQAKPVSEPPTPAESVKAPATRIEVKKKAQGKDRAGPTSRPFLMVLSFGNEKFFAGVQGDLLDLLRSKLEVLHGLSNERVAELIGSPDLVGVLVTDATVTQPANAYLVDRLVEFAQAGGTVVMGGSFGSSIRFDEIGPFFQEVWGVPWQGGDYTSSEVKLNSKHEYAKLSQNQALPETIHMKALHITGITPETAVYLPTKNSQAGASSKKPQAPVALISVEKGRLGYVGDVGLQEEHSKIVLAMFGLL
ncbi:hypothetical protein H0H81_006090 [Sphagnurus paluster]|uniref:C3H1-type domain-containing protein n=1 Tax=Sphagnurus paluster TaxID=117069 RepID=A0A9P7FXS4_9AGAR|nr:hypothetical protein H0H81_006090 [Sphagnurus paluster]